MKTVKKIFFGSVLVSLILSIYSCEDTNFSNPNKLDKTTMQIQPTAASYKLPSYLPKTGLVGWWPFNGNANDESGNNRHATLSGGNTPGFTSDRLGVVGKSVSLTGANSTFGTAGGHIIMPELNWGSWSAFTISIWAKEEVIYDAGESIIQFGLMQDPSVDIMIHRTFGDLVFRTGNAVLVDNAAINYIGAWQHYVMVYKNQKLTVYQNGILKGESMNSNTISVASGYSAIGRHWWAGSASNTSTRYTGLIDDFAIYNRALTTKEITAIYKGR